MPSSATLRRTLDNFDFTFNKKMNRSLIFDLATGAFIGRHEDALFLGPPGSGKSHLAQAIGQAAIQQATAKPTLYSTNWPTPRLMARAKNTWSSW